MLSDPLSITYDSVVKTLPRVSYGNSTASVPAEFVTSNGEFRCKITEAREGDMIRFEVLLERVTQDADGDPFTGNWSSLPNRVGLVFEVNRLRFATSTDLPLLQAALLSLVDSTFRSRVISGEK